MTKRLFSAFLALILAAACTTGPSGSRPISNLPPEIVEMAAPDQDLTTVRLKEEDGCYWYSYVGPVETTELPLRTREGRPICTRPQA